MDLIGFYILVHETRLRAILPNPIITNKINYEACAIIKGKPYLLIKVYLTHTHYYDVFI